MMKKDMSKAMRDSNIFNDISCLQLRC
jgi:hypothetical protein